MAVRAVATEVTKITIPKMVYGQLAVRIKGLEGSRLVTHRFAQKAMQAMLVTQMKLNKSVSRERAAKDPVADFVGGLYCLDTPVVEGEFTPDMLDNMSFGVPYILKTSVERGSQIVEVNASVEEGETIPAVRARGRFGFPSVGFKAAMATAAIDRKVKTTVIHRNIRIPGELIEIESPNGAVLRADMVRLQGMGNPADIRFRPEFTDWKSNVIVQFDRTLFDEEIIVNLVRYAGWTVGLGEWRQEKGGPWGGFEIDNLEKMKDINF